MKRQVAVPIIIALLLVAAVLAIYAVAGLTGPGSSQPTAGAGGDAGTPAPRSTRWVMHEAARAGDAGALQREIAQGAAVNTPLPAGSLTGVSRVGVTPLMLAAESGSLDAVKTLLTARADPDAKSEDGWTALMVACASPSAPGSAAEAIIESGAGIDEKNTAGQTALMLAASGRHAAKVVALLNAGATVDVADGAGATALALAASGVGPAAASGAPADAIRALLEAGANPNAPDAAGLTPLMRAAARDDVDAVMLLLDHGATVDSRSAVGKTALDYAKALSATKKVACVPVLVDAGAN